MPIPRIAIIGRPNAGKSSLLNMLAGAKVSIVDPAAGTTRDRVTAVVDLADPSGRPRPVELTDTGGFGAYTEEGQRFNEVGADLGTLRRDIEAQIAHAVESADLILFCIDAQAGITPLDQEIARRLREGKLGRAGGTPVNPRQEPGAAGKVRLVATKVDGPKWEAHGYELAALGFGEPLLCSAKNNYFRRDLVDGIVADLPADAPGQAPAPQSDLTIAIIGKRNAGKSSLVNRLAGQERVIVSEIAGTTRDAVDVRLVFGDRSVTVIDTAGLRRRKSFANRIEWWAFDRAQRSIERADVVLLLIDATEPVSQVDQQLAMLTQKAAKPVVIVVNKWDLVEGQAGPRGRPITPHDFEEYLRAELKGIDYAPIALVSAATGRNVKQTMDLAFEVSEQARKRVGTGQLNRLVSGIIERRGPASKLGTFAKVYYVAQVKTSPPTIVLVVNKPSLFDPGYMRFLVNRFREELPFPEVPIRVLVRPRRQKQGGGAAIETADAMTSEEIAEVESEAVAEAGVPDGDAESYFDDE
ncbi:MAG: ribosome biogenesis GTPase Der [Phycisphaerales bacterium]|nr:ribosome biogenesis GTPase Der [Phycisphaerales bacterium]